jgi:hypothetical protein
MLGRNSAPGNNSKQLVLKVEAIPRELRPKN